tara:strand:+ start:355 stop:501 length:147 start_codon:yes stop_codon:yes gene_type:complete
MMRRSDENNNKTATILQKHRANTKSDERDKMKNLSKKEIQKRGRTFLT